MRERRRGWVVTAGCVVAVLAVVGLLSVGRGEERTAHAPVGRPLLVDLPGGPPRAAWAAGARRAGLAFLRSYLAVIDGQVRPGRVIAADRHLRRDLEQNVRRIPPAQAGRAPRIAATRLVTQGPRSAQLTAVLDDGGLARYPIVVHLESQPHGRWVAVALGDD